MRRRRPEQEESKEEFLDEDDQTKLIDELQAQSQKQQSEIQFLFQIMCLAASVACFFIVAWIDQRDRAMPDTTTTSLPRRVLRWTHVFMAIAMFYVSFRVLTVSQLSKTTYLPVVLYLLLTAFALFSARTLYKDAETVFLHQGLALANLFVLGGAFFLRWDEHSTKQSFQELKESQYRFKSL